MSQDDQPGADGPQAGSEDYAGTPRPDAVMGVAGGAAGRPGSGGGYPKDSDFRHTHHQRGA
jgi:hypothetical protein